MKQSINLLYYSNALIAEHGGRLHSEAFLKEARKNKITKHLMAFPEPKKGEIRKNFFKDNLKKIPLLQIIFFYRRNFVSYKEIIRFLKDKEVDCLHIRVDSNFLIIDKIKKNFPEMVLTTEVNASPFDENFKNIAFKKYFKTLESRFLSKSDANFFVSSFLRKSIMKNPDPERDFVVHNGVDLDLFCKKEPDLKKEKQIVFGYVGTLEKHKNIKILIDAFELVHSEHIRTKLLIIGDGPIFGELQKYIMHKNLQDCVEFTGAVPHTLINSFLQKMDIAVHHSANPYMSPLKIFEYLAAGLPVIGPDIPAVREIFLDGHEILLVKNKPEFLAEKMKFLLFNRSKRNEIALSGHKKVVGNFGWDSNASAILNILLEKFCKKKKISTPFFRKTELGCPV